VKRQKSWRCSAQYPMASTSRDGTRGLRLSPCGKRPPLAGMGQRRFVGVSLSFGGISPLLVAHSRPSPAEEWRRCLTTHH
jgi:hypothetical protein